MGSDQNLIKLGLSGYCLPGVTNIGLGCFELLKILQQTFLGRNVEVQIVMMKLILNWLLEFTNYVNKEEPIAAECTDSEIANG